MEGKERSKGQRPKCREHAYRSLMLSDIRITNGLALKAYSHPTQLSWTVICHLLRTDQLGCRIHPSIHQNGTTDMGKPAATFMGNCIFPMDMSQLQSVIQLSSSSDCCFFTCKKHFPLKSSISETFENKSISMKHSIFPVDPSHFDTVKQPPFPSQSPSFRRGVLDHHSPQLS